MFTISYDDNSIDTDFHFLLSGSYIYQLGNDARRTVDTNNRFLERYIELVARMKSPWNRG